MMEHDLGMIAVGFPGDRTHAEAADVFDAAILDDVCDHVERLAKNGAFTWAEVGNAVSHAAIVRDFGRKRPKPLFGAEVNVKLSAGVELFGDQLETVWLGGGFRGLLRSRSLTGFVATSEREQSGES